MATSFAELKKSSKNSVSNLQEKLKEASQKTSFKRDERYWRPTRDENGNALAIIRFLPAPPGEELSYVSYFDHSFSVNGRYYIERSLSSIGKQDPIGEMNKELWDSGDEDNRKLASERKRKLHYVANILVIKDTAKPELNGRVMLYEFGRKIFDKIKDQAQPELEEDTPYDIFNMFEGKNFRVKVKTVAKFPNYDDSSFMDVSAVANGDEEEMERIWNSCHSLEAEVAEDKFKSYDELKKKLDYVLNGSNTPARSAEDRVKSQIGSIKDEDDFNVMNSELRKVESKKDDDDDFQLDLSDFTLESDDVPF